MNLQMALKEVEKYFKHCDARRAHAYKVSVLAKDVRLKRIDKEQADAQLKQFERRQPLDYDGSSLEDALRTLYYVKWKKELEQIAS